MGEYELDTLKMRVENVDVKVASEGSSVVRVRNCRTATYINFFERLKAHSHRLCNNENHMYVQRVDRLILTCREIYINENA